MERFSEIYDEFEQDRLSCVGAARILGCSERHFHPLRDRFADEDLEGQAALESDCCHQARLGPCDQGFQTPGAPQAPSRFAQAPRGQRALNPPTPAKRCAHYSTIVIEDLAIRNMMRSARGSAEQPGSKVAQKSGLNRSIGDAAWGRFVSLLVYRAERAGGQFIRVNPNSTSNLCSRCQRLTPSRIGDEFCCAYCGHTMDRDQNAAPNILARGVAIPVAKAA